MGQYYERSRLLLILTVCVMWYRPVRDMAMSFCSSARYKASVKFDMRTSWWRHQMETFSALLAICAGNSPVSGEFPAQRPVKRSFDVFLDLRLNERLSKHSWGWWLETPWCPLWRHSNVILSTNIAMSYVTHSVYHNDNPAPYLSWNIICHVKTKHVIFGNNHPRWCNPEFAAISNNYDLSFRMISYLHKRALFPKWHLQVRCGTHYSVSTEIGEYFRSCLSFIRYHYRAWRLSLLW